MDASSKHLLKARRWHLGHQARMLVLIAAVPGISFGLSTFLQQKRAASPLVTVPTEQLRLGEVWLNPAFRHSLTVTNHSSGPISATLVSSCTCTKISPARFRLRSGESHELALTLDLQRSRPAGDDPTVRKFRSQLALTGNGGLVRASWELDGTILSPIKLPPLPVTPSDPLVVGREPEPLPFMVDVIPPFRSIEVRSTNADMSVSVKNDPQNSGRFMVICVPPSGLEKGEYQGDLVLRAVHTDGWLSAPILVPVEFRVTPAFTIAPAFPHWGVLPVDHAHEKTLTVLSRTGESFTVEMVRSLAKTVLIKPADGERHTFKVRVTPERRGPDSAEIVALVRPAEHPTQLREVTARFSWFAVSDR